MCGSLSEIFEPSKQTSTSSTTTGPGKQYQSAYSNILKQAQGVAGAAYDPATEKNVAGFTQPTYDAFSGVYGNQGVYQPYASNAFNYAQNAAAPSTANIDTYMNPYVQNVVDATQSQFNTQNTRQLNDVRSQAAKLGALGGSGQLVSEALTREAQMNAQNPVIAGLYNQGYSQALGAAQTDAARQLSAAGVMGNLGGQAQQYGYTDVNALLGIGGLQQQQQQSVYDAATGNAQQRAAFPYQNLQWLSGIASGLGGASGGTTTGTQSTPGPSVGQQLIGAGLAGLSFFNAGGRVGYEGGGTVAPYGGVSYIPQANMSATSGPTPSLAQASGTPPSSNGMEDMLSSYKQAHSALAGIGRLGEKMRTSTDANSGWSTTVNPSGASGWGNYLSNTFGFAHGGGVGRMGYADGGDVLDLEEDETGAYGAPEMFPEDAYGAATPAFGTGVAAMAPTAPMAAQPAPGAGVAPVMTPEAAEQGGGLFGWSPEAKQALLHAGLGIMASKSPNVGVALGEGGLMGAQSYEAAKQKAAQERLQREKMAQAQSALDQRQKMAMESLALRREQHTSDQRYKDAQIAKMEADLARGDVQQVGSNLVRLNPDGTVSEIYTGKPTAASTDTPEARALAAEKYGLDPNSDAGRAFILTGKLPREDQQLLTATDKKAILEADETVASTEGAITSLTRAKELSKTAYEGATANERAWVASQFGSDAANDTRELKQVVTEGALQQLKAIFGGMPTEGERKVLLEVQGSAELPQTVRDKIYDRAITLANRRLEFNKQRAAALRGGTFYKPGGSTAAPNDQMAPRITNDAEFDALPSGTEFIDPEGNKRVKP